MRDLRDGWDVQDVCDWVAEGLAVERLRVRLHGCLPALRIIRVVHEADFNAQAGERDLKKGLRTAVEARGGDNVVAGASQVRNSRDLSRHARGESDGCDTAFQGCETVLQRLLRRVRNASVNRARISQGETVMSVLGVLEDIGRGHVDRLVAGPGIGVDVLTRVDGAGVKGPIINGSVVVLRHAHKSRSHPGGGQAVVVWSVRAKYKKLDQAVYLGAGPAWNR